jgi:hypothetical protein
MNNPGQRVMMLSRFFVALGLFAVLIGLTAAWQIQANAADTGLDEAMSKAQRRGVPIFVYVYDSI